MVYETITGPNHPSFQISSPRQPKDCENLRGLYFRAVEGGRMAAYEFTTDPVVFDTLKHDAFLRQFSDTILNLNLQDVFALTLKNPYNPQVMHEFEMPDLGSTVLVQDASWLPQAETSTSTDWGFSQASSSGPRKIAAMSRCTVTRSNHHHEITKYEPDDLVSASENGGIITHTRCIETRSGSHHERPKRHADEFAPKKDDLMVNGELLLPGSEAFEIVTRARNLIAAF